MNQRIADLAITYGQALMQKITDSNQPSDISLETWIPWTRHLWQDDVTPLTMQSIWSMVTDGRHPGEPRYMPVRALGLEEDNGMCPLNPGDETEDFSTAISGLVSEFNHHGGTTETDFDRFYYLMQKYASTLPCTYGEEGVSLFRQWTMASALMAITEGKEYEVLPGLGQIGVDLPGIQTMVYTITALGAGKGVRGRSAFIQLLISAVVDRIVKDLDLCQANVIVNAGGNALILCKWDKQTTQVLKTIEEEVNQLLFNGDNYRRHFAGFRGDLALALAYTHLPHEAIWHQSATVWSDDLGKHISPWQAAEKKLKDELSRAKMRPFKTLIESENGFKQLFETDQSLSGRFCDICSRPEGLDKEFEEDERRAEIGSDQPGTICPECNGFRELAKALAYPHIYLNRSDSKFRDRNGYELGVSAWQEALHEVSGYWYSITQHPLPKAMTLALRLDDFPQAHVDGFRLIATATPTKVVDDESSQADADIIRDNSELAEDTRTSLKRLGVLKADVDNLANILATGVDRRSAAQTAMLSDSLTLFFGGWLDKLCRDMEIAPKVWSKDKVYILYAGGDDLLIIGTWDVMPYLAQRIAQDFEEFTGENPGVHLSAGIVLVGGKEPLYAAADAADSQLDQAKGKGEANPTKNSINFLGKTYQWHVFGEIIKWQRNLVEMRSKGVPASLIGRLLTIYEQYRANRGEIHGIPARGQETNYHGKTLFLGPWLWNMIYSLGRVRVNDAQVADTMAELQRVLLEKGGIEQISVSARWAQFITREGK
ncbi:MAG: type III-A CRISPR-associated protein Cas10/Csm1 [Chloroflexota bacterium]